MSKWIVKEIAGYLNKAMRTLTFVKIIIRNCLKIKNQFEQIWFPSNFCPSPFVFQVSRWTPIHAWTLAYLCTAAAMAMISPSDPLFRLVVTQDTGWTMKSPFYVKKTTGGVIHSQLVMVRTHSICKVSWPINQK